MRTIPFMECVDVVGSACKPFSGTKKYVSTGAVAVDHINEANIEIIDYKGKPSRANLEVMPGNVIFAKMQGTKKTLMINSELSNNIYSTGFCAVQAKEGILTKRCLYHLLTSETFLSQKDKNCSGATQKAITNAGLEKILIRVPDVKTQGLIADRLDVISRIIAKRQKELAALDDLIKARFVELFGEPEYNTKSWPVYSLDKLCEVGSSKRIYQNEQSVTGVPFWRVSDLVSRMETGSADSGLYIPDEKFEELKQAGLVPTAGDILVTSRGTLGRCYIIKKEDRFYFQDGMISWLSHYAHGITPLFLQFLFSMPGFRKQIDNMQAGSTVAYLSIAMLKKLRVMVPSEEMQKAFASFISQVDKSKFAALIIFQFCKKAANYQLRRADCVQF